MHWLGRWSMTYMKKSKLVTSVYNRVFVVLLLSKNGNYMHMYIDTFIWTSSQEGYKQAIDKLHELTFLTYKKFNKIIDDFTFNLLNILKEKNYLRGYLLGKNNKHISCITTITYMYVHLLLKPELYKNPKILPRIHFYKFNGYTAI